MRRVVLGSSGLVVSAICLGGMSVGDPARGEHSWVLGAVDGAELIEYALDLGVNFIDTAAVYADGSSEALIGRVLRGRRDGEAIVVSTKVSPSRDPANRFPLDRKRIEASVKQSLTRLGRDRIDLLQLHRLDPTTSIERTLEGLEAVIQAGLVGAIGASSMPAWQFMKALSLQERYGFRRFGTMHNELNLLYREEERETIPLCLDQGIALVPYSPLARGRLAAPGRTTSRAASDAKSAILYGPSGDMERTICDRLAACAAARGVSMATIALTWVLARRPVGSVTIGATRVSHLEDAVAALEIELEPDEIARLEEPYRPRMPLV